MEPRSTGSERNRLDVESILSLTGGNPLFATEVLASGVDEVPSSVRESVLARAGKISPPARDLLALVSVIPGQSDLSLVAKIVDPTREQLAEGVRQGLLVETTDSLSFRHELQRRAIESSLTPTDRRRLNRLVLTEIAEHADPSRSAHHALETEDVESIIAFVPRAAEAAMAIESHREALAHFRALEPCLDALAMPDRAALVCDWARVEFYLDNHEALDVLSRAEALYREIEDEAAKARMLAFAVRVNEVHGRPDKADACAAEAITILESLPPGADLAFALSQQAWLKLMRGDDDLGGVALADRAIAIAEAVGDDLTVCRSLILKGCIGHSSGGRTSESLVEEGRQRAELGGHRYQQVYALILLAGLAADIRDVDRAMDLAQQARDAAIRYEIRSLELHALAIQSELLLWKGDWAAVEDVATEVLGSHPHVEVIARRVLGILATRRGNPDAGAMLDLLWSQVEASGELQNMDPAAAALAEFLWVTDSDHTGRVTHIRKALDLGERSGFLWPSGALAFWSWKLGILTTIPGDMSDFYRSIIDGGHQAAAEFWRERGVPYEEALALMHGDQDQQIEAIRILDGLGAVATANRVRHDLADQGVRVPRGRSRSTRDHSAGLTVRQAEVLDLLAEGLTNAEIGDRHFVSIRTVENHVAAVLMKLDASSRGDAVSEARRRGILADPSE